MIGRKSKTGILAAALGGALLWASAGWAKPLIVGTVTSEPTRQVSELWPLAKYAAKQLQSDGIDQAKVVTAENVFQMAAWLREGKVDVYVDGPFRAQIVSELAGTRMVARWWKGGLGDHHSVIFARKDGGMQRLEQLNGKVIALSRPGDDFGCLLPKMIFQLKGGIMRRKASPGEPVASGELGYVFSDDDENTLVWVLRGKVAAGAMDSVTYRQLAKQGAEQLQVIHETVGLPGGVVSVPGSVESKFEGKLVSVLKKMGEQEDGVQALRALGGTTKFDTLPADALAPLQGAVPFLHAEFGLP